LIFSVASGKGGTGKTTLAVNLALSLNGPIQLLDCDVEDPDVHIFLKPSIREIKPVRISIPRIDQRLCNFCGECANFCQFHAIAVLKERWMFFQELCHGCGGCRLVCPKKAIFEEERDVGVIKFGEKGGIELAYGELNVGEPMPGPVIRELKRHINPHATTIIDAPPGTSCPVIQSVYGSDYCILVTEPTPFGLHDLRLMVDTLKELKIPFGVVVNRAGIGNMGVYDYCKREGIPILLEIPFDRRIAELYSRGIAFVTEFPVWKEKLASLISGIREGMKG
jgi:MinD superfamily P-loop ATPase